MKNRTVADIHGPWIDPDFQSGLIERCKQYWHTPVNELPDNMVATYLEQQFGGDLMIEEARKRIESGIEDDSQLFDGQLKEAVALAQKRLSPPVA